MALTQRQVAQRLFRFFDSKGMAYCVVGAKGTAIGDDIGVDIDIIVDGLTGSEVIRAMRGFCHEINLFLVQIVQYKWCGWRFDLAWFSGKDELRFLHPDVVCGDYVGQGRVYLTASEVVTGRTRARDGSGCALGYFAAAPATDFIYYLIKKVDKQSIEHRHGNHLSATWHSDPEGALAQIRRFWSGADVEQLARAARDNEWSTMRAALPHLRRSLRARLPASPRDRWRELLRRARRVMQPTGLCVVFLGPDGSGKSSVIEQVVHAMAPAFRRTCKMHLRPRLVFGARTHGPVNVPHGAVQRGVFSSVAKVFYFIFDYTVGYLAKVWPLRVRSALVVFDRYYHDLLVDPYRYRYGGPRWLVRLAARLIPKPNLWIVLDAPPEVLRARKQEVPFEETVRQRNAYVDLAARLENAVVVDAAQPLDRVVADATRAIVDHMAERIAHRLG